MRSYVWALVMPERASCSDAVTSCELLPIGQMMPSPVTATRLMAADPSSTAKWNVLSGLRIAAIHEQADFQILGLVNGLSVDLHHAIRDAHHQLAHDDTLHVDGVAHHLGRGKHH